MEDCALPTIQSSARREEKWYKRVLCLGRRIGWGVWSVTSTCEEGERRVSLLSVQATASRCSSSPVQSSALAGVTVMSSLYSDISQHWLESQSLCDSEHTNTKSPPTPQSGQPTIYRRPTQNTDYYILVVVVVYVGVRVRREGRGDIPLLCCSCLTLLSAFSAGQDFKLKIIMIHL